MKALVRDRYGPPAEVLRFEELDTPVPTGDQVLVRVTAASLNAADLDFLHGRPTPARVAYGLRGPRNRRLGVDVAGTVQAVGEEVTRFRPGDEVFADMYSYGMGSFAEYVCASEKAFLEKPGTMTFEEAATFPHAAILALQGLRAGRPPRAGERMLMNGASGNVGPFAVQIAKALGMHVTGVASTAKVDFVRSIGADDVIDYTEESFPDTGRAWDRILDVSATRSMFEVRRALSPDGVYTWLGGTTGSFAQALLFGAATSFGGRQRLGFTFAWRPFHPPDVATLVRSFEDGAVKPVIDRRFPLDQAIEALRYMDDGHARGKVVLTA
jgi:NADPH:quinone reductase-like Zn-dependent oxidoreductase